jgi:hypothetical protein
VKQISGTFLREDGSPASGATLTLKLNQDASSPSGQIMAALISIVLDSTGNIPSGTQIWCNDELSPATTFYHATVQDGSSGTAYRERLVIAGNSPINLNSIVPAGTP